MTARPTTALYIALHRHDGPMCTNLFQNSNAVLQSELTANRLRKNMSGMTHMLP